MLRRLIDGVLSFGLNYYISPSRIDEIRLSLLYYLIANSKNYILLITFAAIGFTSAPEVLY